MNTDQGGLFFRAGIDNSQLRNDAQESRNILKGVSDGAVENFRRIDSAFAKMSQMAGSFYLVNQFKDFAAQIVNVRAEMEKLEISFQTLLGSRQAGQAMFNDIRQFAVSTPMMLQDLAKGAQTMLAFNIEAEKVMPMLRAIGDISMGDAGKFGSLSLAFSQMSATGKLMGQDLLQMINAGFNPLAIISEKTGKSIGDLKKEMESGKITVEMVTDAFLSATSAGGQFYGMLEKQSKGIAGQISNLQGAIEDMFNEIGMSSEGVMADAVGVAASLVKSYKEVGEALAVIIGLYGTYKAVIIANEAIKATVTAVNHAEEAAQLYAVLGAEQQARISKLGLATTSEEYRLAVIAEIEAEMQRQTAIAQSTQVELTAARERLVIAEQNKVKAAENVAARKVELEAVITEATAERNASIAKRMAAESESQSRAKLLAIKLEEQKQTLVGEARKLKEASADAKLIAAKNRQIATISEKIAAAKAEEVQCSLNVVALRKEMQATLDAANSKKIAAAESRLETAQNELNTASKARNTAAREVSSKTAAVNVAVTKANTLETAKNTAGEVANTAATGLLAKAKNTLTAAATRLNAVLAAHPYAILTAAAVGAAYAIYKITTHMTEAQKAQERYSQAVREYDKEIISEKAQISALFAQLKAAKEGTEAYAKAKDAILNKYGAYLDGLGEEVRSLKDVSKAYDAITTAATKAASARALEAATKAEADVFAEKQATNREKIYELLKKQYGDKTNKDGGLVRDDVYWQLVNAIQDPKRNKVSEKFLEQFNRTTATGGSQFGPTGYVVVNDMKRALESSAEALEVFEKATNDLQKKFGEAPSKEASTIPPKKTPKEPKVADVNSQNEANQIAVQTAERNRKLQEYAKSVAQEARQAELDIAQASIDAMEDGVEKELRQNELNYRKLIQANDQRKEQMVEALRDARELEWENANPTAKKNGMVFNREIVTENDLSQAQKDTLMEYERIAEDVRLRSNKETLDRMLADVMTYEQQRLAVAEEFERRRQQMYETVTDKDGNFMGYKTDAGGNYVLRQGVTKGNLEELNRQEEEALKGIDENFASLETQYQAWCEQIAIWSLEKLRETLEETKRELARMEKENPNDKKLAAQRAKVNKLQDKVDKQGATENLSPGKRTIKEWEDLYKTLMECEREFESLGDTVGGTLGTIINTVGEVATGTLSMINGIQQFAQMSMESTEKTAEGTSNAVQAVEKASLILTIITAALKIATTIANLFKNDEAYQEEIDRLQGRIDQLQWELDNEQILRYTSVEETLERVRTAIAQTRMELWTMSRTGERFGLTMRNAADNADLLGKSAGKVADYYASMAYTADKALGSARYEDSRKQLENIAQQQVLISEQIDNERAKKDSDANWITEKEQQIAELGQKAIELINTMVEDIIGGTSSDIAEQLADSFIEAFQAGEDAAQAWGDKVNEIVADIMKRMLVQKFLEEPLGEIFNKYKAKWFPNGQAADNFLQVVIDSMGQFAADLNAEGDRFKQIWENLPDAVRDTFTATADATREAANKGIATASQESVDELNGRATAIQGHTYSIMQDTKSLLSTTNSILRSVMNIEGETNGFGQRMARVESHIKEVRDTLSDIRNQGLKIK